MFSVKEHIVRNIIIIIVTTTMSEENNKKICKVYCNNSNLKHENAIPKDFVTVTFLLSANTNKVSAANIADVRRLVKFLSISDTNWIEELLRESSNDKE